MLKKLALIGAFLTSVPALAAPMGILPFAPVRQQIKTNAVSAGALKTGERLTLKTSGDTVTANIWGKGGMTGQQNVRLKSAEFKLEKTIDGTFAKPVEQGGQVWQNIYYLAPRGQPQ
jgi:hypothetical protein